jgi:predicted tellurium resistance membrane protein TerC
MKTDLIWICLALIVLDSLLAPLLRTLISEPSDAAYFAFRLLAVSLVVLNAFVIAMMIRQFKKEKSK